MWPIVALLLLRGEGGLIKAAAFAAGAMTVRLLQGLLVGYIFATAEDAGREAGPDLIASTVLLVVGVFLVITAVGAALRMGDDSEAPPPKWMTALHRVSAPAAFGIGAGMMLFAMKQWIFTLSALAVIEKGQVGVKGSVFAYLFFVVAAQSLMLTPIISQAVASTRSAKSREALQGWLERHNRKIAVVASLIFGTWFIWKGATDLLGLGSASHYSHAAKLIEEIWRINAQTEPSERAFRSE
jgi:hypothetical protein